MCGHTSTISTVSQTERGGELLLVPSSLGAVGPKADTSIARVVNLSIVEETIVEETP